MSTTRFGVYVHSSWVNAGPDAHYAKCADGFDSWDDAVSFAYNHLECRDNSEFVVESYDATDDIAFESQHDEPNEWDYDPDRDDIDGEAPFSC